MTLDKSLQDEPFFSDVEPTLRVTTRPNDANPGGDIFGGWLMSQIDMAGAIVAKRRAQGPVVTVAVKDLIFIKPIFVYDVVSFYAKIEKVGKTSMTVKLIVFSERYPKFWTAIKVAEATVVYVAVDKP